MAEVYELNIYRDSLKTVISHFNGQQDSTLKDSVFKIDERTNPYIYVGNIIDRENSNKYYFAISYLSVYPTELKLFSVENTMTGDFIIINDKPRNRSEIKQRKLAMQQFEERILKKLNIPYVHKGNAMLKKY